MTALRAFAKLNLSLRVRSRDAAGFHPIRSLVQSIDWFDDVAVERAEDADAIEVMGAEEVPAGEDNLAWRAVAALRSAVSARVPLRVVLTKRIPAAAGMGGGSADAAAALVGAAAALGVFADTVRRLAPDLGADVPFCLTGGTAWMEGRGERLTPARMAADYVVAVAVAPFTLATGEVYRRWDALDEPRGASMDSRFLPPSLRHVDDLGNDLTPAAVALRPELADWLADLARLWERPVLMTGSGPAAFALFGDRPEAEDAAAAVRFARASEAALPIDRGWDGDPGGTLPPPPWGVV
ncbi:MAG: 4-(cytidine 5'-diphospho)-2-C-methyl-D-erythritol kinase [Actinobacteria bacterium RBG_16_68_21]|nr:MAG: 4-(cytidine 5'-diphospho)-2-C-methyl-D-erythritol kinase [Actinobacteria bacterium RBG_16_68_21]